MTYNLFPAHGGAFISVNIDIPLSYPYLYALHS